MTDLTREEIDELRRGCRTYLDGCAAGDLLPGIDKRYGRKEKSGG